MSAPAPADSLAAKVAVITGASKAIGRATALRLASLAASVVINYASSTKDADEPVQHIGSDRAVAVKADSGSIPGLERLVSAAVDKFGRIDILIPNPTPPSCKSPGPTGTELFFEGKSEQLLNTINGWTWTLFGRIGEPDEIAEVIAFVSGPRWVNCQVFEANGGMA
ncbi:uncharacterized protein BKCO1_7700035 [Diplodia corticola]|uniref:Uncharacterized protein n=1 Tax=Diplodia corticola TaxID=236234 RepID=A0A1J9QL42_9PEZI|nr:uncharacterized protein BKCO1_7700035 [Diplodia corticola]OJD29606.1 hypothetical protein BKCO1_7700035 [Diplodia corticola]